MRTEASIVPRAPTSPSTAPSRYRYCPRPSLSLSPCLRRTEDTHLYTYVYIYIYIHTHTCIYTYINTKNTYRQTDRQTYRYTYTQEIQQHAQTHECGVAWIQRAYTTYTAHPRKVIPHQLRNLKQLHTDTPTCLLTSLHPSMHPSIHPSIHPSNPFIQPFVCMQAYNLFRLHDQTQIGSSRQVLRPDKTTPCPFKIQSPHTPTMAKDSTQRLPLNPKPHRLPMAQNMLRSLK